MKLETRFRWFDEINLQGQKLFEEQFAREIMISERLIVTLLSVIFLCTGIWFLSVPRLFPAEFSELCIPYMGLAVGDWFFIFFAAASILDFIMQLIHGRFIRSGRQLPMAARYGNAFIEISVISLVVFLSSKIYQPVYALFIPITFFYFIFIFIQAFRLDLFLCLFAGFIAAAQYSILSVLLVSVPGTEQAYAPLLSLVQHFAKGSILLAGGLVTGFVSWQIRKRLLSSYRSVEEKNRIVDMFGQHVSPAVVNKLMENHGTLTSEMRSVCVMFLDIRNFTGFSEGRNPEEIVQFLNYLFEFMIEIVNRHNGIINKFLGDGFMAVFGAPLSDGRDCANAVDAAMEIAAKVDREAASGAIPPTGIGMGLHAGDVVTGNVGSSQRKEYTIIGSIVNLASRIESLNKQFQSRLIVTERVLKESGRSGDNAEDLGRVQVRGLTRPVRLFRLL